MFPSSLKSFFSGTDGGSGGSGGSYSYSFSRGGPSIGFGQGGLKFSLGDKHDGFKIPIRFGGGGRTDDGGDDAGEDGGAGIRIPFMPGGGGRHAHVIGRTSRKERENPFVGIENQNYDEITQKCRDEGILFEDPEFPADDTSLFYSTESPRNIEWKRPKDICDEPKFVLEGASRFDVKQGELGDCWLLAAVASLTMDRKLLCRVVPQDQNFEDNYTGCFRFRFWHQGDWIEVVVDDRIPTYYDQLVYMHSTEKNEFWSALLEKAYAKLCGSYEALKGGSSSEAMEDFTGGMTESIDLASPPNNLFNIMLKAFQRSSLMGCSIDADPNELEAKLTNGLICGHAYSITACKFAEIPSHVDIATPRVQGKIPMVRIRNPWGESEWNGAWSDQSEEWRFIPDEEKQEIGLVHDEDGEFWMSFQDFCKNFKKLEICNLAPDSLDEEELNARSKKRWESTCENGSWIPGVSAGGCRNYLDTFWTNPQYKVTLTDADDDDEDNMCTLIVAVLQKDRRKKRREGIELLTIGYIIYRLKEGDSGVKDVNFFKYNASCAKSPSFINMREICGRHKLEPGSYIIVPSTFEPRHKGDFLMRVFSEKANQTGVMDEQTGLDDCQEDPGPTDEEREQGERLRDQFRTIAGEDLEVDAFELREILNTVFSKEFEFDGFGIEPCRSMIAMHDGDMSGKLGLEEFKCLWKDLRVWKANFKNFDSDSSGCLNSYELRSALRSAGFKLSNSSLQALVARYSNREGQIAFADFIMCAIRLKSMLASFKNSDPDNTGIAAFHLEDFIQIAMYS